jgi:hypothetical protein
MSFPRPTTPLAAAHPPHGRPPRRLSEEIDSLLDELRHGQPVRLGEVITVLHGRAYTLLLIVLAAPFCTPVPLPGVSTPFGALIALIGLRLSLGQKPWLPARLLNREFKSKTLTTLLGAARRVARTLETVLQPRWSFLVETKGCGHLTGSMILVSGLLLLLPLPIPFTNLFPALTVVLLSAAMVERDGYATAAGMAMFVVSCLLFGVIALGGAAVVQWLEEWFGGVFDPDYEAPETPAVGGLKLETSDL